MGNYRLSTAIFSVGTKRMHRTRFISYFASAAIALIFVSATAGAQAAGNPSENGRMPITTSSPEARALFEQGVVEWENLHISRALEHWQAAIEKDPNFLLAHLYISERIPDPGQQAAERKKVLDLMGSVTPGEQLMAQWIIADGRGDTIAALSAMNELGRAH